MRADKNEGLALAFRLKGDLGVRFRAVLDRFEGEISDSNFARMAVRAAVEAIERDGQIPMPMRFQVTALASAAVKISKANTG
jgi:hypothetical protein